MTDETDAVSWPVTARALGGAPMFRWMVLLATVVALIAGGCSQGEDAAGDDTTTTTIAVTSTTAEATTTTTTTTAPTTTAPTTTAPTTTVAPAPLEGHGALDVSTAMVSGESTRDIWVWAPSEPGPWPVVYAVPGGGGKARRDMEVVGVELASHGVVFFSTDWRTNDSVSTLEKDIECGYRYALSVAEGHGGDLTQPVTLAGFSAGATGALYIGLDEARFGPGGTYEECAPGAPRPDVVVALDGCYVTQTGIDSAVTSWANLDADLVLLASTDESIPCPSEADHGVEVLKSAGYDVVFVEVADSNHGEIVFHDSDNNWETLPGDHPAGQATVQTILDAIEAAE